MSITASELTVGWDNKPIAQVNSLRVAAGSILVVAGPNGAGKSTLIKTLARQIAPLSGAVQLDGVDVNTMKPRDFARKVAYVPQMIELLQDLTVKELVQLGRNPHQMWWSWQESEEDEDAIKDALQRTNTWSLRNNFLGGLSGGERQRASIAMALAQNASFILLDEPTAHLDFKHQLELVALLRDLQRNQNIGLLVILHDLNLIARLADDVLFLKKQDAISIPAAYGPVDKVMTREVLRTVYEVDVSVLVDPETQTSNFFPYQPKP